jgi:hypothetical protein
MKAQIRWKTPEEGGRKTPPYPWVGPSRYAPHMRFCDDPEPWGKWALLIETAPSSSEERVWITEVRYVFDNAPRDELRPGREFELYEGGRCVATGILIG